MSTVVQRATVDDMVQQRATITKGITTYGEFYAEVVLTYIGRCAVRLAS